MRKGDRIVVIAGEYRGRTGIIRRPSRDGSHFIVNINVGAGGLPMSPSIAAGKIRRAEPAKISTSAKR